MKKNKFFTTLLISMIFVSNQALATSITPYRTLDRDNMTLQDTTLEYMFAYGMEMYYLGNYEEATKVFARILELDPQHPEIRENLKKVSPNHPALDNPVPTRTLKEKKVTKSTQTTQENKNARTFTISKKIETISEPKIAENFENQAKKDLNYDIKEDFYSTDIDDDKITALRNQEKHLQQQSTKLENDIDLLKDKLLNSDQIHLKRVQELEAIIAKSEREVERLNQELTKQDQMIARLKEIAASHEIKSETNNRVREQSSILEEYKSRIQEQDEYVKKQNENLNFYKNEYTQAKKEIERLQNLLNDQNYDLNNLENSLASSDRNVNNLKQALTTRDIGLKDLERSLSNKDQEIARLKNLIVFKDKNISELNSQLAEAQKQPKRTTKAETSVGTPLVESIKFIREQTTMVQPTPVVEQINTSSYSQKQTIENIGNIDTKNNITDYEKLIDQKDHTIAALKDRLADMSALVADYHSLPIDVMLTNQANDPRIAIDAIYPRDEYIQSQIAAARLDLHEQKLKIDEKDQELSHLKKKIHEIKKQLSEVQGNVQDKNATIDALQKDLDKLIQ